MLVPLVDIYWHFNGPGQKESSRMRRCLPCMLYILLLCCNSQILPALTSVLWGTCWQRQARKKAHRHTGRQAHVEDPTYDYHTCVCSLYKCITHFSVAILIWVVPFPELRVLCYGPLAIYVKLRVAHALGMPGTFPCHRGLATPTCITARTWRTCRDACRDR